jgi:Zn-dependent metalloprotease
MRNRLTFALLLYSTLTIAQNNRQREIDIFCQQTGAIATVDNATGSLSYLRFPLGKPFRIEGVDPGQKALSFLAQNANLIDIRAENQIYQIKEIKRDHHGLEHAVLQQYYRGVPVWDGIIKFHFNNNKELTSMNGNFIEASKLRTDPRISKEEAAQIAINKVTFQKKGKFNAPLRVGKNTLYIFQKGLAQGYHGAVHLVYELEVKNDKDVREFLYIDAHSKELVEQFTGLHSINRKLIDPSGLIWQESNGINSPEFATLDKWQKSEIETAGHVYNLMKNTFGRTSYDNADAAMTSFHNHPAVACPNAYWTGYFTIYCTDAASDDVVAHEWAHAYTEYTSGLIYSWQPGALNESYSDIWGETVDQLNEYFDEGENPIQRTGCESSSRWRMGEQAIAFGGAIRDMWDPNCNGDPGKVSDPQYWCSEEDGGGVHTNSGILNHAYALLVDGGSYNGQNITGLGLTKAAHIFWHAQSNYMTYATDFAKQADILEAALTDLIGINLPKLSTEAANSGLSGIKVTPDDLLQLSKVITAVEMRMKKDCGYKKLFAAVDPICTGALPGNAIFYENFENGLGNWTVSNQGVFPFEWTPRDWVLDSSPPDGRPGTVAFADNFAENCIGSAQAGVISLISPEIAIPASAPTQLSLAFDHYVALENLIDGGNVRYKIGAEEWKLIPKSAFTANGYNAILTGSINGGHSPLEGQPAFSGGNQNSFASDWGQSRIDLTSLGLLPGQTIQFQWDLGTDFCGKWDGWYIDDIRVYSCATPTVQFVEANSIINEGEANNLGLSPYECLPYAEKKITVKINKTPSQPVTVTFNPPTGTATLGPLADYTIMPNSFVLGNGILSQDVTIRAYNDGYSEGNESLQFTYSLSSPPGGDAIAETFNQQHILVIVDDDLVPGTVSKELVNADFNKGIPANWNVVGGGGHPETWSVQDWGTEYNLDDDGTPFLAILSSDLGPVQMDGIVETPPFNSIGSLAINLSFIEHFEVLKGGFDEQAIIDVWDGTQWQNLSIRNEATGSSGTWYTPAKRTIAIPLQYMNPAMKIRFRYIANDDLWWFIDNVKVNVTFPSEIQSAISTNPDAQYLGPNTTVYFHDPTSGNLIAKIKNLTAHDYGCTSVQVDRAGVNETAWFGNHKITNKTFKVTPTNNNPNGNYEITLYYKASELTNFNGAAIKSMGKSEGGIAGGTLANSNTSSVQKTSFNSDFAYTATFNTGFSGFGLSDAPAGTALPVALSKFEGRNTAEGNFLLWETEAEVNNDYFIIQRSRDGRSFEEIARISGIGNSAVRHSYSFTDSRFQSGLNYYRLKQVDNDGTFAYSRMISLDATIKDRLKFFPNPVGSVLTIQLPDQTGRNDIKIINSAGRVLMTDSGRALQDHSLILDVSKLPAGVYEVVISNEQSTHSFPIVKIP